MCFSGPGSATWRLASEVGAELVKVPGHLVALELGGRLLVGGRPELYPFRLPLTLKRALRARQGGSAASRSPSRGTSGSRGRATARRRETRGARARVRRRQDVRRLARRAAGRCRRALPGTVTRSTAEPEEISMGHGAGYFALVWSAGKGLSYNVLGGTSSLIDRAAAALPERILTGAEASSVTTRGRVAAGLRTRTRASSGRCSRATSSLRPRRSRRPAS